jgi:hypothetical protein
MKTQKYLMRRYDLSGGIDMGTNPFMMEDTKYTYLKNVNHNESGSLSKDGGYSTYLNKIATVTGDDLIFDYTDYDGNHEIIKIAGGTLYKGGATAWATVSTGVATANERQSAVNYLDRVYIAGASTNLWYYDGTTVFNGTGATGLYADNGNANVRGKYLTTIGSTLYLGNVSTVHKTSDVVYTMPDSHVFYDKNEDGFDTYATTSHIIPVIGNITGIKGFRGMLLIFTESDVWQWNPATLGEAKILAHTGCVAHDTIQEIDGILYWAGKDGVYRFDGDKMPSIISLPITNWVTNSVWRLINGTNWANMSAGVLDGRYYLWLGTLTAALPGDGSALTNVVVVFDTYRGTWSFYDTHPVRQWATITNSSGNKQLLFGSNADGQTYVRDYSYKHNTTAITSIIRTKYFDFDNPEAEKVLDNLYVSYRPEAQTAKYLSVAVAINGSNSYTTYLNNASSTRLPLTGAATLEYQFERVSLKGLRARTASYEFKNADSAVDITLLGFSQEFDYIGTNLNYTV